MLHYIILSIHNTIVILHYSIAINRLQFVCFNLFLKCIEVPYQHFDIKTSILSVLEQLFLLFMYFMHYNFGLFWNLKLHIITKKFLSKSKETLIHMKYLGFFFLHVYGYKINILFEVINLLNQLVPTGSDSVEISLILFITTMEISKGKHIFQT